MKARGSLAGTLAVTALSWGMIQDPVMAAPLIGLPAGLQLDTGGVFTPPPELLLAQCGSDGEDECNDYTDDFDEIKPNTPVPSNTNTTEEVVDAIEQAKDTCSDEWIDARYRIDCIRQTLLRAANELPNRGDYAPMRAVLIEAAAKLDAIVAQNLDAGAGSVAPNVGGRPLAPTLPPLRAVDPAAAEKAIDQAVAVLEETQTLLLRSAAGSSVREPHYQLVAQAVDSTKVLLRSS